MSFVNADNGTQAEACATGLRGRGLRFGGYGFSTWVECDRPGLLAIAIGRVGHFERGVPRNAKRVFTRGEAHTTQAQKIGRKLNHFLDESRVVFRDEARDAVDDEVSGAALGGDDRRNAGGRSFLYDVAEGVRARRENEQVHIGVGLSEFAAAENAWQNAVLKITLKPLALTAVTNNDDGEIRVASGEERAFDIDQKADIFFRSDAADEAQAERGVVNGPMPWIELIAIDAPRHEERRAVVDA